MSHKWSALIIATILLAAICGALEQSITENKITIISDKEAYHCEPIYNEKGQCLVRAIIKVQYLAPDPSAISVASEFTTAIKEPEYKILATSNVASVATIAKDPIKAEEAISDVADVKPIDEKPIEPPPKGEELIAADTIELKEPLEITKRDEFTTDVMDVKPSDTQTIQLEFWADKDGKFNIVVDNQGIKTTLDPTYTINISAATPTYLLQGADVDSTEGINYTSLSDVTSTLSDNNAGTKVMINVGEKLYPDSLRFLYKFNNPFLTNVVDDNGGDNDMTRLATTNITRQQDFYSMGINYATNGGGLVVANPSLLIPATSFTYCARWNSTATLTNNIEYHIMSVGSVAETTSYAMYLTQTSGTPRVGCEIRDDDDGGTYRQAVAAMSTINNGNPHTICCRRNIGNSTLQTIVDGNVIASTTNTNAAITTNGNLIVSGWQSVGNMGALGYIDELALWTTGLTNDEAARTNFYNSANGSAIQTYFNYTQKTYPNYHYALKIMTDVTYPSVIRVYSMINSTHINPASFVEQSILSGENMIDVSSISGTGYNYPYRIITSKTKPVSISDISLIETGNDSIAPHIENCFVNDSNVGCGESVEWGCSVYDTESDVATAIGVVSFAGMFPLVQQAYRDPINLTKWSVKLSAAEVHALLVGQGWGFNMTANTYMSYVSATDLAGNVAYNITSQPSNIYSCIEASPTCTENWQVMMGSCLYNDTQIKTYTDLNNCNTTGNLPLDNGTYIACNFCSQNIITASSPCVYNGTENAQNQSYTDLNYYSCCALTGLLSDCSIDYTPYNQTTTTGCVNQTLEFMVNHPDSCEFDLKSNDKCYFQFDLNRSGIWNCLSTIRTMDGSLLQTNPTYTAKADTLISLGSSNYEDRKYFEVLNGLGTAYFTKENLIIGDDRQYIFSIECSNGTERLQSDLSLAAEFANINEPITRLPFIGNNAGAIVAIIIGVIVVLMLAFFAWRLSK